MRRLVLSPPISIAAPAIPARGFRASLRGRTEAGPLTHTALAEPHPGLPGGRLFFNPASGWFRRLERAVSLALSRRFFPRVPGAARPYGRQLQRELTVSEADVRIGGLPASFDGATILLVADVHAGPFLGPQTLQSTLDRLLLLEPDAVLLGGDLVTTRVEEVLRHLPAFGSLRAPLGVFAVMGNHDHYTRDPERLRGLLEDAGVHVLCNSAVHLERSSSRLALAGIDDLIAGEPDLDAALAAARRHGEAGPVLLLSHNPDVFPAAARRGVALVLSGHTHGGQIRIPGLPVLVRMSKYRLDEGRYQLGGSELVVSRGLGVSGIPLRLACPPEAVLLTLRKAGDVPGPVPP